MASETAALSEHWIIVNGLPLFYRAATDAAPAGAIPIVHVHGFGISGNYLVPTAERLAPFHPTYVPDLPGYGRSRKPSRTLTIPELASALVSFLDAVDVERAILLGNSMGCMIALEFAHEYPDRIERAILVSPAGGPHNQPLYRGLSQMMRDSVRESVRLLPVAVPDYVRFGPMNSFRLFRAMTMYPTIERAQELSLPILAVVGTRDPLVSRERLERYVAEHPHITLVMQDNAAHAINFSHPRSLSKLVLDWLRHDTVTVDPAEAPHTLVAQADTPVEEG
jgi:pimeloyl-ACP methyl ester carboxylesterase